MEIIVSRQINLSLIQLEKKCMCIIHKILHLYENVPKLRSDHIPKKISLCLQKGFQCTKLFNILFVCEFFIILKNACLFTVVCVYVCIYVRELCETCQSAKSISYILHTSIKSQLTSIFDDKKRRPYIISHKRICIMGRQYASDPSLPPL